MTIDPDDLPWGTRLILASEDLLAYWGTRTEGGDRITVEWGERTPGGWYEPAFTVHTDDNLLAALREAEDDRARLREALEPLAQWAVDMGRHYAVLRCEPPYTTTAALKAMTQNAKAAFQGAALASTEEPAPTEPEAERQGFLRSDEPCPDCGHPARHHTQGGMCDGAGSECHCIRAWPISREQEVK